MIGHVFLLLSGASAALVLDPNFSSKFSDAPSACQYCENDSFSKKLIHGKDPATGESACVCYALPKGTGFNMFCGNPGDITLTASVQSQGGCMCVATQDAHGVAAHTCEITGR